MAVSTTAQNKKDVDSMNVRDRLYDSLSYTYGKRGEDIEKQYNKLASQTNNSLLSRGMQRSSYGAQTAANIGKQMVDALGQNASDLIADYENRLYQVEQDEREQANWEKQYQESIRQYNEEMAERKRQFDLQYALQSAAASGAGGAGGTGGYTGDPNAGYTPPPGLSNGDQELAAADAAMALFEKGKQIQAAPAKQMQIDQYQRQINALTKRLGTVKTVSERNEITNQIGVLNQKIRDMR